MKTVVITGAGHGIGHAAARRFAAEHCRLQLTCRRSLDELESLARSLSEQYEIPVSADLLDVGDASAVGRYFAEKSSHTDILINNAGISYVGLLQDMTAEEWNRVIAVNLSSMFYTAKQVIPQFLLNRERLAPGECPGRIINVSSVWGGAGAAGEVCYSASKGGVNSFTRALAKELAPSGIPVNAIACGCIDTRMNACFNEDEKRALCAEIPAGRFASPEEVAEAILHISQMPAYVTGQIIAMDGGWI